MAKKKALALFVVAAVAGGGGLYWHKTGGDDLPPGVLAIIKDITAKITSGSPPGGGAEKDAAPKAAQAQPRGGKGPPVPVATSPATLRALPERLSTIGTAQALAVVGIKARTDSVVETQHFVEGQEVKAGDLLFTLDDRMLRAQLAQSEANLERDTAQLEKAQGDVARYTQLVKRDAVARQQFDAAISAAAALEATVKADRAAIDSAKVALSYTRMYSPVAGRTGTVAARPGTTVRLADTTPLVTITQLRPINVAFNVPERHLNALRAAMAAGPVQVEARVSGVTGSPEMGRLVFIDSQVDTLSGTILAKAEFPNDDTRLWPGQFVDVGVVLRIDHQALTVPDDAVQISQDGRFVFVVKADRTAEMRPVTVARSDSGFAMITGGLQAGDQVVVDGQSRLIPGSPVLLRQPGEGKGDGKTGEGKAKTGAGT